MSRVSRIVPDARARPLLTLVMVAAASFACTPLRERPLATQDAAPPAADVPDSGPGASRDASTTGSTPDTRPPDRPPPDTALPRPDTALPRPDTGVDRPASPADAGAAASRCPASSVVCDGFERAQLGFDVWTSFGENGSQFSIVSGLAARGERSVRLHLDPGSPEPVGVHTGPIDTDPLPDPVWVRFFQFMPESTPRFSHVFLGLDNDEGQSVTVDWDDRNMILQGTRDTPMAPPPPRGRWVCMLVKAQTGGAGELSLYLDGASTPTLTSPIDTHPILHRVLLAISPDGRQTQPVDIYIDEVLVSRTPIGCAD
jgi:hypothetical protein